MGVLDLKTTDLFTGQREMAGLGIYHYGARFYSPKLGRFLSADTIVPGYANPQNLNRYSYVINNPLLYTDPTGYRPDDGCRTGEGCNVTQQTIVDDLKKIQEFHATTESNKCKAGDKLHCSYAENHPVETAAFALAGLLASPLAEYAILNGGTEVGLWWLQRQIWKANWVISAKAIEVLAGALRKIGMDSKFGSFLMKQFQNYATHYPKSDTMVFGSYPHYVNTGAANKYSYYSVNNGFLYKVLEKAEWAQTLNDNAVYDAMSAGKTVLIDFQAASIGEGLQNEIDILDSFHYLYEFLSKR